MQKYTKSKSVAEIKKIPYVESCKIENLLVIHHFNNHAWQAGRNITLTTPTIMNDKDTEKMCMGYHAENDHSLACEQGEWGIMEWRTEVQNNNT